ncbi:MAG: hypothetical protein WC554_12480 [Clostridia bacterium]
MAWTTPKTWTGGELVTEDTLNEQIRDNFNVVRNQIRYAIVEVFAPGVTVTTGNGKKYIPLLTDFNGMNIVEVYARVITAGTTGTTTIQINNSRTGDVLSTRITIDSGETGSNTAAAPAVINATKDDIATYDNLRIDVDGIQTTAPLGLIVVIGFQYP